MCQYALFYTVTNFQKSPSAGVSPPPALLNLSIVVTWSCVLCPGCVFSKWLWQNRSLKIGYDVISVTSSLLW